MDRVYRTHAPEHHLDTASSGAQINTFEVSHIGTFRFLFFIFHAKVLERTEGHSADLSCGTTATPKALNSPPARFRDALRVSPGRLSFKVAFYVVQLRPHENPNKLLPKPSGLRSGSNNPNGVNSSRNNFRSIGNSFNRAHNRRSFQFSRLDCYFWRMDTRERFPIRRRPSKPSLCHGHQPVASSDRDP